MSNSEQKTSLFFRLSISVTVFSTFFSFIPSSLIIAGTVGMVIFLSIQLYQKKQRIPLDYARLLLVVSFASNFAFGIFESALGNLSIVTTKLALIGFLFLYIKKTIPAFQDLMQKNSLLLSSLGREQLSFILAEFAIVYIVVASLFIQLHWEIGILNGNLLLIMGLFSALTSILASSKALAR